MIYFTSDSHFNDKKLIERESRPFKSTKLGDKYIIKTWNKQAHKSDIIYVIGDFISYSDWYPNIYLKGLMYIKKIKAKVILIIGNNEERLIKSKFNNNFEEFKDFCLTLGFTDVKKEEFLELKKYKFYLNHYPKNHKENYINLFGHIHKLGGIYKPYGINISCDMNFLQLYSLDDIIELLKLKKDIEKSDPDLLI